MNVDQYIFTEIDQIIGCGQRDNAKYFLVRFKNAPQNELIDWETAKEYSLQVMEYFGSRLVWDSVQDIINPEDDGDLIDQQDDDDEERPNASVSSSSAAPNPPNDIEYEQ